MPEPDWTRAQALRWRRERDEARAETERLRAELAHVSARFDRADEENERLREAGIRVGMYGCGFSRATATEMFDRELGCVSAALDDNDAKEK